MRRVRAEVLNAKRIGAYHSITIVAPDVAERVRPGQFISIGMPEDRAFLLRRQFSIHQASRRGGWAGTLEFIVDPRGEGTAWLAEVKAHQFLDVIGPLGTAFAYPAKLTSCLHGKSLFYSRKSTGDFFQIFHTLQVSRHALGPRARGRTTSIVACPRWFESKTFGLSRAIYRSPLNAESDLAGEYWRVLDRGE